MTAAIVASLILVALAILILRGIRGPRGFSDRDHHGGFQGGDGHGGGD